MLYLVSPRGGMTEATGADRSSITRVSKRMNVLIVGAGAVGLVYGQGLAKAGHKVTFFVKDKHLPGLSDGVTMIRKRRIPGDRDAEFDQYGLLTQWQDVGYQHWDYVLLAIPSDALRVFPLLDMKATIGPATVVMLQPSDMDYQHLRTALPESQIVKGMINLICYYAPLAGEAALPQQKAMTVAWYLPPSPMPLSGDDRVLPGVLSLFRSAGFASKAVEDAVAASRGANAVLMTFLCALEASEWSFAQLRSNKPLLREMVSAQKALLGFLADSAATPAAARGLRRLATALSVSLFRIALRVAPYALPFSLETYFKAHFMKVRNQTALYMQDFCARCDNAALASLRGRVFEES